MDDWIALESILFTITPEFEEIGSALEDFENEWTKYQNPALLPRESFRKWYTLANGMNRIKGDLYFSFKLFPLKQIMNIADYQGVSEEQIRDDEVLQPNDDPSDWLVFAQEGEFGLYCINCAPGTSTYGTIYGIINNIPERFNIWHNFQEFIEQLPKYCHDFPLVQYREDFMGSCPTFGNYDNEG